MTMTVPPVVPAAPAVRYVEGFEPGYLGRIAQMHGEYYAKVWGSGAGFEAIMAHELCEFFDRYDITRDLLLTAHVDGVLAGCIAIDGTQAERPGLARLRWFILEESYQGHGIGKELLKRALAFCQAQEFPYVYLWTVEGLPESRHLYEKAGFQVVQRLEDSRYTVEHTQIMMELPLDHV
jgi:GNAT superfamily N-acetyltransferase